MHLPTLFTAFSICASQVLANCECGYSAQIDGATVVFTDLLETDFVHLANVSLDTDWVGQEYNVSATDDRGAYGEVLQLGNIISNPIADNSSFAGPGKLGGDAGVELYVRSALVDGDFIPTAQIDSARNDMYYGTYRAGIKLTNLTGTCGAFFWYYNDSQEIDMEFLSSRFNAANNSYPVQLVLQSEQSVMSGYNAANTDTYVIAYLPFDPTDGFHEYRFDFVPGQVLFYADGTVLATMNSSAAIPDHAGQLILSHWSNGNKEWSVGPPKQDAAMTISYVKAYFNSSSPQRQSDYATRCVAADLQSSTAICAIPDQTTAPNPDSADGNSTADVPFFMNEGNSTDNQTVYHQTSNSTSGAVQVRWDAGSTWGSSLLCLLAFGALALL